jgi:alkanesulfonate monooxygenase SsuD/methylene tetrahydromethanopterin reductase-like flavin-dependent oxidoreductase (luciferase family)
MSRPQVAIEMGVHLPLMEWRGEGHSLRRLQTTVDAARECGFGLVSANDHFVFATPWLDGLTALAAVAERAGDMTLATTISLASLRGPVPLANALAALDILCEGRLVAGVGPGSSPRDYEATGVRFAERWPRFDEAVTILRSLLRGDPPPSRTRHFAVPDAPLRPPPRREGGVPLWIRSGGSAAGLRRVARLADGWLASAYNTTPEGFRSARELLASELAKRERDGDRFPNALVTMWTWVSDDGPEVDRMLHERLAPMLKRDPSALREQLCIGPAEHCAELLSRYASAGCERVLFWPLGDEPREIERLADEVRPLVGRQAELPFSR